MKKYSTFFFSLAYILGKNIYGIIQKPHKTYIVLSQDSRKGTIILIWMFIGVIIFWTTALKTGIFKNPMYFAINALWIYLVALFSFFILSGLIWFLGYLQNLIKIENYSKILILWGFTYIPTICWFTGVSLIFFFFPPPRSFSLQGYAISAVLIGFSLLMFYWKLLLYYLTLRIGFKITWNKILFISIFFFPLAFVYSYFLNKMGIFKVPFI